MRKRNKTENSWKSCEVKEQVFFRGISDPFYLNAKLFGIANFSAHLKVNKLALKYINIYYNTLQYNNYLGNYPTGII